MGGEGRPDWRRKTKLDPDEVSIRGDRGLVDQGSSSSRRHSASLTGIHRMAGFFVAMFCRFTTLGKPERVPIGAVGRIDPPHVARVRFLGGFHLIVVGHGHTSAVG